MESMHQVLMQKTPAVELHFLTPIHTGGQNRRDLARAAYDAIVTKLAL
jgi:hypothetical protein